MFGKDKKNKDNLKKGGLIGLLVLAVSSIIGWFSFKTNCSKKIKKFIKGEKREIDELQTGQETFRCFLTDSGALIRDLFIPHEGNDHKPKALRPKPLLSYALIAILIKVGVTGFLFFTYPNGATLSEIVASKMVNLANQDRQEAGVEPLSISGLLVQAAIDKGQDMIEHNYFAHDAPDGKRPWQWIDRSEYDYVYAGENLAMDFKSAEVVQEAFMKSPTHRKNILNPKYKEIGIAVLQGEINGHKTILLVEFFGTQRRDTSTLAAVQPVDQEPTPSVQPSQPQQPQTPVVEPEVQPGIAGQEIENFLLDNQLEAGTANEGIIVISGPNTVPHSLVDLVIEYSNIFFVAFLIFIFISLFLNIFIKINVQHSSVILQGVVVIALLLALILVKFHFVEQVAPHILIL